MWMTMLLGFVQLYYPLGMYEPVERKKVPKKFYQNMMIVGSLRWVLHDVTITLQSALLYLYKMKHSI